VIHPAIRRRLMTCSCFALLLLALGDAARLVAVALPAKARAADREHALATSTPLEAKRALVVHRPQAAKATNLPRTTATSIVCSKPASIG
jgi:hypothetical protein